MENNSTRPLATGLTIVGGLARLAQNLNFAPVGALSLCLAPGFPNAGVYTVTALLACGLAGLIGLRVRRAA